MSFPASKFIRTEPKLDESLICPLLVPQFTIILIRLGDWFLIATDQSGLLAASYCFLMNSLSLLVIAASTSSFVRVLHNEHIFCQKEVTRIDGGQLR